MIDADSLRSMMLEVCKLLKDSLIAQPKAFRSELHDFNVLFAVIPPYKQAILVLTLTEHQTKEFHIGEHDHHGDTSSWQLKMQVWGWEMPAKKYYQSIVDGVYQIVVTTKLKDIFRQLDRFTEPSSENETPIVETDSNVLQWLKHYSVESLQVKLHALCTPAVFLSIFFQEIQHRGFTFVLSSFTMDGLDPPCFPIRNGGNNSDSGRILNIGNRFYFLYASPSHKTLYLTEVSLKQVQNDAETTITSLFTQCSARFDDSLFNHIPQSLHGGMSINPPYSGLFLSIQYWSVHIDNDRVEDGKLAELEFLSVKNMLLAVARQARME